MRRGVTRALVVTSVTAFVSMAVGCAAPTPSPATSPAQTSARSQTARQVQALELAPPTPPVALHRDVAGRYELELVGEGELAGQRLDLELRHEPDPLAADVLAAQCRAGLWDLEGSAEGGGREPLAVSMMGLSDRDEAPVAMRLIASSVGAPSGDLEGTAIVEHGGVATTLRFVARRRAAAEASRQMCGGLVYQHETHYQGPGDTEDVTTRRFEGCVEVVDEPPSPTR